ncbi:MAG: nickel pincer cofactor biosynthesis protein LarC [Deltaproteobacteria bacterium]
MTKIAYFDCSSGVSGDMIVGALLDAGCDFGLLLSELAKLNIADYSMRSEKVLRGGISATKFTVIGGEKSPPRRTLRDIYSIIDASAIEGAIKSEAKRIFLSIAEAEAKIHAKSAGEIHFHEIGAVDTIIDIAGALLGLKILGVRRVFCSSVNLGSGFVEFSHGRFPVPAPATVEILKNIPVYSTDSQYELATPTGAAVIAVLAERFGGIPRMKIEAAGYGAGARDLPAPNALRVFIGEAMDEFAPDAGVVSVIESNIDDMNPEIYDYAMGRLFDEGALDVYLTNIFMKKNRPAVKLTVISAPEYRDKLIEILFRETTTIGVRWRDEKRGTLQREVIVANTEFGAVRVKVARLGQAIVNAAPEYEDCRKIAEARGVSLKLVYNLASQAAAKFIARG